jgi:hypothetical protein
MKHFLAALLAMSGTAYAANAANLGGTTPNTAGIVTVDMATGMRQFNAYTHDALGYMVVCVPPAEPDFRGGKAECDDGKYKNAWTRVHDTVPKGRTYVGFRIANGMYGGRLLEVYWK